MEMSLRGIPCPAGGQYWVTVEFTTEALAVRVTGENSSFFGASSMVEMEHEPVIGAIVARTEVLHVFRSASEFAINEPRVAS
jgi:hypothetical protein